MASVASGRFVQLSYTYTYKEVLHCMDATLSLYTANQKEYLQVQMKGTEVPNPRHSSACDCTCVLARIDHCLMTLSCLPCTFCFVPAYVKFAHEFLMLFHRPCATYL